MKNILLITQHFPPENSGGIGRSLSLYKYMPVNGFNVIILTQNGYGNLDNENNIYRANCRLIRNKKEWFSMKGFFKIISKLLYIYKLTTPRDFTFQYSSTELANKIINSENIDLIYATFPSLDSLIVALKLHKKYKIPLVTEFRDGLLYESIFKSFGLYDKYFLKKLERDIVNNSNLIITIGNRLTEYFTDNYKIDYAHTVFNGFDKSEFEELKNIKYKYNDNKVRMVFFGRLSLTKARDMLPLLTSLSNLKNKGVISSNNFELHFIGDYTNTEKTNFYNLNLNDITFFHDKMNKIEGFKKIVRDFNYLLYYGFKGETTTISSKIFEYIKLNKPIMGICKGNETEDIISNTKTGEICDFDEKAISELFTKIVNNEVDYSPIHENIDLYDRERQTKDISTLIKNFL